MPGGVSEPLSQQDRDAILETIPEALAIAVRTLAWLKKISEAFRAEVCSFGNFPSLFMGIVKEDGSITFYDGKIRIGDATGNLVADGLDAASYYDYLGEKVESVELPEIRVLQATWLSGRHVPRRDRWRGSTSRIAAEPNAPTRNWRNSRNCSAPLCSALSTITRPGLSRFFIAWSGWSSS